MVLDIIQSLALDTYLSVGMVQWRGHWDAKQNRKRNIWKWTIMVVHPAMMWLVMHEIKYGGSTFCWIKNQLVSMCPSSKIHCYSQFIIISEQLMEPGRIFHSDHYQEKVLAFKTISDHALSISTFQIWQATFGLLLLSLDQHVEEIVEKVEQDHSGVCDVVDVEEWEGVKDSKCSRRWSIHIWVWIWLWHASLLKSLPILWNGLCSTVIECFCFVVAADAAGLAESWLPPRFSMSFGNGVSRCLGVSLSRLGFGCLGVSVKGSGVSVKD